MSLKKKIHTDQIDWFPWRKKLNISSYFYNVYVSVFLAYFLCFSFNDWLVVVLVISSACLSVFLLPIIHVDKPVYSIKGWCSVQFCLFQLLLLTAPIIPPVVDELPILSVALLRVLPSTSAITGMMLTALPSPPSVCSVLSFNTPYLLYLWATTLVFGLSSM